MAAQSFVAGVSRNKAQRRELSSDIGRKDFGFAHEEWLGLEGVDGGGWFLGWVGFDFSLGL